MRHCIQIESKTTTSSLKQGLLKSVPKLLRCYNWEIRMHKVEVIAEELFLILKRRKLDWPRNILMDRMEVLPAFDDIKRRLP